MWWCPSRPVRLDMYWGRAHVEGDVEGGTRGVGGEQREMGTPSRTEAFLSRVFATSRRKTELASLSSGVFTQMFCTLSFECLCFVLCFLEVSRPFFGYVLYRIWTVQPGSHRRTSIQGHFSFFCVACRNSYSGRDIGAPFPRSAVISKLLRTNELSAFHRFWAYPILLLLNSPFA